MNCSSKLYGSVTNTFLMFCLSSTEPGHPQAGRPDYQRGPLLPSQLQDETPSHEQFSYSGCLHIRHPDLPCRSPPLPLRLPQVCPLHGHAPFCQPRPQGHFCPQYIPGQAHAHLHGVKGAHHEGGVGGDGQGFHPACIYQRKWRECEIIQAFGDQVAHLL